MVSHLLLNESSRLNLVNAFFRQHCSNFFRQHCSNSCCRHHSNFSCAVSPYCCHLILVTALNPCRPLETPFHCSVLLSEVIVLTRAASRCGMLRYKTTSQRSWRSTFTFRAICPHRITPMESKDLFDLSCLNPVPLTGESARFAVAAVKAVVAVNTNLELLLAQLLSIPKFLEFILSGRLFWISIAWFCFDTAQRLKNVPRYCRRVFYRNIPLPLRPSRHPLRTHFYNNSIRRYSQYRGCYQRKYPINLMGIANTSCLPLAYWTNSAQS